jgi:hypothetical protein
VTEPPCGDSSFLYREIGETETHWTGAKSLAENGGGLSSLEEGITRLKCGRSDIKVEQRSETMSCSDKILKWNYLGI